jgi:peptidoglycan hydrolase-like protein with peptidoglycan-binding domain
MNNLALLQTLMAQVQLLESKLTQLAAQPVASPATAAAPATTLCFTASKSLSLGMTGADVTRLQNVLATDPDIYTGPASGTFDATTQDAVTAFQLKNNIISDPADGGVVGPKTLAFFRKSCPKLSSKNGASTLSITNFSGPTVVAINTLGTWNVQAIDSNNEHVAYAITWGDEDQTGASYSLPSGAPIMTAATAFSHAYTNAGTYFVTVTAEDQDGLTTKASLEITVQAPSSLSFISFPATGTAPLSVQFSANGLSEGSWYSLDFGDGSLPAVTQTLQASTSLPITAGKNHFTLGTSHTYRYAGVYSAVLRTGTSTLIGAIQTIVATSTLP